MRYQYRAGGLFGRRVLAAGRQQERGGQGRGHGLEESAVGVAAAHGGLRLN